MKLEVVYTARFQKSFKKISAADQDLIVAVLERLSAGERLEPKYRDHALKGKFKNCRDCYVRSDLVLVYQKRQEVLELVAVDIGKHSNSFKK